ncbi:MAG: 50S ribosomal protein L5 [Phycisphaerales bacterium]|nr:50S ribosomal protein L5 [Phycisphaerales bacterium]
MNAQIVKLVLNTTSKLVIHDKKLLIPPLAALEFISGQKPKRTYSKKSISNFQLRQKQCIGCKVTLRGKKMYNFLEKCRTAVLPNIRDFPGLNDRALNGQARRNLNFGIDHLFIFPELVNHFEFFDQIKGLNVSIVTSSGMKY